MAKDYLGIPINIGDTVIFPTSGEFMRGEVVKLGPEKTTRYGYQSVSVKNENGYTKKKYENDLLNISTIKEQLPEYFL